jgi:hypothetical protein
MKKGGRERGGVGGGGRSGVEKQKMNIRKKIRKYSLLNFNVPFSLF